MSNENKNQPIENGPLLREASEWLLRLRDPDTEPDGMNDWLEWSRHASNLDAFEKVQNLTHGLDALDSGEKAAIVDECLNETASAASRRVHRYWPRAALALAACVTVGVAALAASYVLHRPTPARSYHVAYTTAKGQSRDIVLPDGSRIELGADSNIQIVYRRRSRGVKLTAGEAYFKVKHDAARPFLVSVGDTRIRDLGTEFDVRRDKDQLMVSVAEGKVSVSHANRSEPSESQPEEKTVALVAGQRLLVGGSQKTAPTPVAAKTVGAWRTGRLHFRDAPLSAVVATINRYSHRRIIITDPAVARLRYTGTVLVKKIDAWLAAAEEVFPVREKQNDDNQIVLYLKSPA
jgi:transmembrane sensor